jgi:hypothetical protein
MNLQLDSALSHQCPRRALAPNLLSALLLSSAQSVLNGTAGKKGCPMAAPRYQTGLRRRDLGSRRNESPQITTEPCTFFFASVVVVKRPDELTSKSGRKPGCPARHSESTFRAGVPGDRRSTPRKVGQVGTEAPL